MNELSGTPIAIPTAIVPIVPIVQTALLILLAPLLTGFIKKFKARLQGRIGPRLLQPYYDLYKFMRKDTVVSQESSWLFTATPYIVFGATIAASTLIPAFAGRAMFSFTGDLVLFVYLFALARFFIAMAGVDTGSSFGAQGASRDLFVSSLAEPVLFVAVLAAALPAGSTNLAAIFQHQAAASAITPAYFMLLGAFVILLVTETGRVPVDNPDTHLELTMIHEGALLEYSGKPLALLLWSAWIKQMLLFSLFVNLCLPWGSPPGDMAWPAGLAYSTILFFIKILLVGLLMAIIEMSNAKMRLFKVPRFLAAALMLSLFAIATEYLL
jgi:formate hydrogenlyase subunit 4